MAERNEDEARQQQPEQTTQGQDPTNHGAAQQAQLSPTPEGEDPGRTLGLVGLIFSVFIAVAGLIISLIAYSKSKKAGYQNSFALAGIIVGAILTILGIFWTVAQIAFWNNVGAFGMLNPYNPFF